jgi:hypothetical protein
LGWATGTFPEFPVFLVGMRIPVKATMDSDAWRPLDPVDDDQGGA